MRMGMKRANRRAHGAAVAASYSAGPGKRAYRAESRKARVPGVRRTRAAASTEPMRATIAMYGRRVMIQPTIAQKKYKSSDQASCRPPAGIARHQRVVAEHDPMLRAAFGERVELARQPEQVGERRLIAQHAIVRARVLLAQRRPAPVQDALHRRSIAQLEADAYVHDRLLDLHAFEQPHPRRLHLEVRAIGIAQHLDRRGQPFLVPGKHMQPVMGCGKRELVALRHQRLRLGGEAVLEARVLTAQQLLYRQISVHGHLPLAKKNEATGVVAGARYAAAVSAAFSGVRGGRYRVWPGQASLPGVRRMRATAPAAGRPARKVERCAIMSRP